MAKKKKKTPSSASLSRQSSAVLHWNRVEFDAGHDGLLRGQPEATFLFGLFFVGEGLSLLYKELYTLHPKEGFPCRIDLSKNDPIKAKLPRGAGHLVLLVIAIEEDHSEELRALYQKLQEPEELQVWPLEEEVPSPVHLRGAHLWPEVLPRAHPVYIMHKQRDLRDDCRNNDFIGASLAKICFPLVMEQDFRMRFVSADQKNDWTLSIQLQVRI